MRIESRQQLIECRKEFKKALDCQYKQVVICGGSGCVAGGSLKVYDRMKQLMEERGLRVDVVLQHESHDESVGLKHSGCHGFCQMGPLMRIEPMGLLYIKVTDSRENYPQRRGHRPPCLSRGRRELCPSGGYPLLQAADPRCA